MYELFLAVFIVSIGMRAVLSIPRYSRYSRAWALRSLLLVGLYLSYSLLGMIVIVKIVEVWLPTDLTEDQIGWIYIAAWLLWMTAGTWGLIRMNRQAPLPASRAGGQDGGA